MLAKTVIWTTCLAAFGASAQELSDRYYEAIRNNNLTTLRELIKTGDVNVRDRRETTPLMYAAASGSLDAIKALSQAGADVNAKNAFDATALMWAVNDLEKTKFLIAKGANVNARSKAGRTPLMIAAAADRSHDIVKLLVDRGADVNAKDDTGLTPFSAASLGNDTETMMFLMNKGVDIEATDHKKLTPLMYAAGYGNAPIVKMLIAKGANVNAVSADSMNEVKNGPVGIGQLTPLIMAAAFGGPETVRLLLDAGARVNAQDVRGMTPLMLAIATDRANTDVIRLLKSKGSDLDIKSKLGETARDWAAKFSRPPVLQALGMEPQQRAAAPPVFLLTADEKPLPVKVAVQKSIGLLQKTAFGFFTEGGCGSCHSHNVTAMAVSVARAHGVPVFEKGAAEDLKGMALQLLSFEQPVLQRQDLPGGIDIAAFALFHLSAGEVKPDRATDALVHNIAAQQLRDGRWTIGGTARPPMEDGDFTRTALAIRALRLYGAAGRKIEFEDRIRRAAEWLKTAKPITTEDRNMQLLGLKWSGAPPATMNQMLKAQITQQRPDGGWSQTAELASDSYATGTTLFMMHELGVATHNVEYRRGVEFLLKSQRPDGSWYVKSRAPKFQPYFQSGFPYDHDQWISSAATAWSAIALSYAIPAQQVASR